MNGSSFLSWHRPLWVPGMGSRAFPGQGSGVALESAASLEPVLVPSSSICDSLNIKHGIKLVQVWFGASVAENGNIQPS